MALPKVGVQVIAQGASTATKQLDAFNNSVNKTSKSISGASSKGGFGAITSGAQGATGALGQMTGALGSMLGPLGAVAAGGAGLTLVFSKLVSGTKETIRAFIAAGQLSVTIDSTARAFGNIFARVGDANTILKGLRDQLHGTVSDFELMRLSVAALQGTSESFRKVVGPNLGKIIDATNRVAQATGQSAEVVREKFLLGLRRQSKLLLDDVGVMVNAADAQAAYAKSIGKSVSALTDLEKQAAFAQAAVAQLDSISAELGDRNQAADSLARISAAIQNIKGLQAIAIAPLFTALAGVVDRLATGFQKVAQFLAPIIRELNTIVGSVITIFFKALADQVQILYGDLFRLAGEALPYVIATIRLVGRVVIQLAEIFARAFNNIGKIIRKLFPDLAKTTNSGMADLAYRFAYGGARIIGAFAKGILEGAHLVITAVTFIAQIVANFLEGFSPPKEGPLKDIDKGATRVMEAWVDGLVNVDLAPLDTVLQAVNDRLGSIGAFSREQVTARLAELDLAIRPFVEQLDIVKADFEAIAGFADPALKAIDRQRSRLLTLAGEGSLIDINRLRGLDKQAEMLGKMRDTAQDSVDNAEIQLALSKAQQAQERALLNIQMRRLGEAQNAAGGGGATDTPATGGTGANDALAGEIADLVGGAPVDLASVEGIDEAMALIEGAFKAGLADSGAAQALANVQTQLAALRNQTDRIQKADPVAKLTKKFAGLTAAISKPFGEAQKIAETAITAIEGAMTGLGAVIDVLAMKFNLQLPTSFNIFKAGADLNLTATLTALNMLVTSTILPMLTLLGNKLGLNLPISFGLFKTNFVANVTNQLIDLYNWWSLTIQPMFNTLKTWFDTTFGVAFAIFNTDLLEKVTTPLIDLELTLSNKVEQAFRRLVQFLSETFSPVLSKLKTNAIDPIAAAFGTLESAINKVKDATSLLSGALSGIEGSVPDWMIPGSPTPFEIGLRGINDAMRQLEQQSLTPFSMTMQKMATPDSVMAQPSNRYAYGGGGVSSQSIDNSRSTQMGGVNINVSSPQEALWMQQQMLAKWGS